MPDYVPVQDVVEGNTGGKKPATRLGKRLHLEGYRQAVCERQHYSQRRSYCDPSYIDAAQNPMEFRIPLPYPRRELHWANDQRQRASQSVREEPPADWKEILPVRMGVKQDETLVVTEHEERHQPKSKKGPVFEGNFAKGPLYIFIGIRHQLLITFPVESICYSHLSEFACLVTHLSGVMIGGTRARRASRGGSWGAAVKVTSSAEAVS
jgi:hypothetical protein